MFNSGKFSASHYRANEDTSKLYRGRLVGSGLENRLVLVSDKGTYKASLANLTPGPLVINYWCCTHMKFVVLEIYLIKSKLTNR